MRPNDPDIRRAPKVLLHDHLDGGLRPTTLIELAAAAGYRSLPSHDPDVLSAELVRRASQGGLPGYLEAFQHTVAVLQTPDALRRVAAEAVSDLRADGVVYAELRFAPELHLQQGLSALDVVRHVLSGLDEAAAGTGIRVGLLLCAMRHDSRSAEIAELVVRLRDQGVCGFDIAGAEAGYPPEAHRAAFELLRRANMSVTVHAGEAFGLPSIWQALHVGGAARLGHGVRLVDDLVRGPAGVQLGRLASFVRDRRIPLEMCPSSNVQTGAVASWAEHPVGELRRLGFRVTVNTDNRLVSGTTLSRELALGSAAFGWGWPDLRWLAVNAMKSAFLPFDERLEIIDRQVKPFYALYEAVDTHRGAAD